MRSGRAKWAPQRRTWVGSNGLPQFARKYPYAKS